MKELGHPQVSTGNLPLVVQIRFNVCMQRTLGYLVGLWSICTRLQVSWQQVLDLDNDKDDKKAKRDPYAWMDDEAVPDKQVLYP